MIWHVSCHQLNDEVLEKFNYFLKLRKQNRPIAYILGFKDFWKYKFQVDKNVLIPRPETEIIIEQALKNLPKLSKKNILDIGTGSGCIIISIIKEREKRMIRDSEYERRYCEICNPKCFVLFTVVLLLVGMITMIVLYALRKYE